MNATLRNIIILVLVLAVVLLVYFSTNTERKKIFQWTESYKVASDQPYGTKFIQELLTTRKNGITITVNDDKPISEILSSTPGKKTDYVFIGQDLYLNETDVDSLLSFVNAGNNAFISTVNLPFDVLDAVDTQECDGVLYLVRNESAKAILNFYNEALKKQDGFSYSYRWGNAVLPYYWNSINPEVFCDSTKVIAPLGYLQPDGVNYFKIAYGDGNIFIHCIPLVFTNYFMTDYEKADYAARALSYLDGDAVVWDEYSKSAFAARNNTPEVNPMYYILQHESLRYAWWLLILTALLYIVFTAKRRQRIIPVIEKKFNTSLEFINMISALHFKSESHRDMARKKVRYFMHYIRGKYGIHASTLNELQIKKLSEKAHLPLSNIEALAAQFAMVDSQDYYDEKKLTNLYFSLDEFYKRCK